MLLLTENNTIKMEEKIQIESAKLDPKNFKVLYDKYFSRIFTFILSRVNDKDHSSDLTSQVFLKALINIKNYKYRGLPFSAWLFRIAINECNQFFRATKKYRTIVLDGAFSEALMCEIVRKDSNEDNHRKLGEIIKNLKMEEVQLLELRFYENKSFREIGYIMDVTENYAKVKLYRLLDKMKKKINQTK